MTSLAITAKTSLNQAVLLALCSTQEKANSKSKYYVILCVS